MRHLTADANNGIMEWDKPLQEAFRNDEHKPRMVDEDWFIYVNRNHMVDDDTFIGAEVSEEGYKALKEEKE